jgi:hypothetical protein
MGTVFFLGVECGRGVTLTPYRRLVPRSENIVALYMACKKGGTYLIHRND